jgi:hypothetical protein
MYSCETAFKLMSKGLKIRQKKWPEDYYIYLKGPQIYDSQENLWAESAELYLKNNGGLYKHLTLWDVYDDDIENHL